MTQNSKHILVAVLDWGLGHATRSMSVINTLMSQGHRVSVAGSGSSLELIKNEFPGLEFYSLTPYNVTYSKKTSLSLALLRQAPRLFRVIHQEHREVEELVEKNKIDMVISDNRYGCWSRRVPSVLISHQLNLIFRPGLLVLGKWINKYLQQKINRFDACWVPDFPGDNLTGRLSQYPNPKVRFIGMLSRFKFLPGVPVIPGSIVALVSGPEPQRTIFEKLLIQELKKTGGEATVVCGLPTAFQKESTHEKIKCLPHLPSPELNRLLQSAGIVICRSGYSTLMDLSVLGKKKIIVVPTPAQTEQEYLAARLQEKNIAVVQNQDKINLVQAIEALKTCTGFETITPTPNLLSDAIDLLAKS